MQKLLASAIIFIVLLGCNDARDEHSFLQQMPYAPLTDSIRQFPERADLYYRRANLLARDNQLAWAKADLQKAWTLQPNEATAAAYTYLLQGAKGDSAINFLKEATQKLRQSLPLQILLAKTYLAKGDTVNAITISNGILQENPNQVDALNLQAQLMKMSKPDVSLSYLEKAHALVPSDPSLAYDLAYDYAQNKNSKVLMLTDSLIKAKTPEVEKAYLIRGNYFEATGNVSEALKNYDAAITANYNFLDAYRDKGELLYKQKRFDESIKTYTLGLRIDPKVAEFYYGLAKAFEAKGLKEDAKLNYQRAYQLDKSMKEAKDAADRL